MADKDPSKHPSIQQLEKEVHALVDPKALSTTRIQTITKLFLKVPHVPPALHPTRTPWCAANRGVVRCG